MEEDFLSWIGIERRQDTRENSIVIVRHAESIANTLGIYQGQTYDTDLSELGEKQAKALAKRLKIFGVGRIITSPLKRTHKTAETIAREVGCEIEFNHKIIETNHGVWEGKHKDWVAQNFPDTHLLWKEKPTDVIFPQGEVFMNTVGRTLDFLENTRFDSKTVVVTHDNIIRIMICLITNSDINRMWEIPLETAALNFFEVNRINGQNVFRVLKLNDVGHLVGLRNDVKSHAL